MTLMLLIVQFFDTAMTHMVVTWMGKTFVKSEVPRVGNEKILNGLQEGVFIIEEETSII